MQHIVAGAGLRGAKKIQAFIARMLLSFFKVTFYP
jgi:hypothetical protein